MIPILYEIDETEFTSNGLGRLRDCISCVVTEERNGIYECDFEYPVTAEDFHDIQIGRIIGVTHDDTGDIQPFDIVSFTRPIDGVVTFHCTHISYRQSYLTVTGSNINSLAAAFTLLGTAQPNNPFTYETDKTQSTGYLAAADGVPKTVRSMLGGVEGSILDAYGGEYEWDKFRVILHSARGQLRNFSIRYGVNMLDYNEDYDSSGTYSSCIPYWTDGTTTVVGDKQNSGGSTITGRGECVPLDVSEKFENQPTKAQVNAMGLSVMNSKNPMIPSQNIHVEFVRLQDMGYEGLENLLQCGLCDTIKVVFPFYNTTGQFKIVKTVWDVLADRYESMELGDLSVTLAEALGISNSEGRTADMTDFVVEQATDGIWTYRKWNSGVAECWYSNSFTVNFNTQVASNLRTSTTTNAVALPSLLTSVTEFIVSGYSVAQTGWATLVTGAKSGSDIILSYLGWTASGNYTIAVNIYVKGKWK